MAGLEGGEGLSGGFRPSGGLQSANFGRDATRALANLAADLRSSRRGCIMGMLAALQAQIKEELSTPGQGRLYKGPMQLGRKRKDGSRGPKRPGVIHRASAPGQPPAPDSGKLRQSIQSEYDDLVQKGRVGTNLVYALPLNFGTTKAGKNRNITILPRPFMEPALKKARLAMIGGGITQLQLVTRARSTTVGV